MKKLVVNRVFIFVFFAQMLLSACTINVYRDASAESVVTNDRPLASSTPHSGQDSQSIEHLLTDTEVEKLEQLHKGLVSTEAVLNVEAYGSTGGPNVSLGDSLKLKINTAVDAYISCYYQQREGEIFKVFPNQYTVERRLVSGQTLMIPEANSFHLVADQPGEIDQFMCLMSSEDVLLSLPSDFKANTFPRVPVNTFDNLYELYRATTKQNLVAKIVKIEVE